MSLWRWLLCRPHLMQSLRMIILESPDDDEYIPGMIVTKALAKIPYKPQWHGKFGLKWAWHAHRQLDRLCYERENKSCRFFQTFCPLWVSWIKTLYQMSKLHIEYIKSKIIWRNTTFHNSAESYQHCHFVNTFLFHKQADFHYLFPLKHEHVCVSVSRKFTKQLNLLDGQVHLFVYNLFICESIFFLVQNSC